VVLRPGVEVLFQHGWTLLMPTLYQLLQPLNTDTHHGSGLDWTQLWIVQKFEGFERISVYQPT